MGISTRSLRKVMMNLKKTLTIFAVITGLLAVNIAAATPASAVTCKTITDRTWKLVQKNPSKYKGQNMTIYGNIMQFDSITGTSKMLAYLAGTNKLDSYGYWGSYDLSLARSTSKRLSNYVQGDVFKACVTIKGSYSYQMKVGNTNTVPEVYINSIKYLGSTD